MDKKNVFITTPIFYVNDKPHIGHLYSLLVSDVLTRYFSAHLQTGTDEHGEKIFNKAQSLGISSQRLVDDNSNLFKILCQSFNISSHYFYRTTNFLHQTKVQEFFLKLLEMGEIYQSYYEGKYCVACEDYVSDKEKEIIFCPTCSSKLFYIKERAYFLKVKKHLAFLQSIYQTGTNLLIPEKIRKEIEKSFLNENLSDLCLTRKKLKWAVPVPNEQELSIYVWFEALCNYFISDEGERFFFREKNENLSIFHVIGKDIARFHSIYWPIILKNLGANFPKKIIAHGWILNRGEKMSKSKGNVIDPMFLLKKHSVDTIRTYFIAKINFPEDGYFDEILLDDFYQDFFVNKLGNTINRIIGMINIYNEGMVPLFEASAFNIECLNDYYQSISIAINEFRNFMESYRLTQAFHKIDYLLDLTNKTINLVEPWKLHKEINSLYLMQSLNLFSNCVKSISFLLKIFAPETSKKIFSIFNLQADEVNWENLSELNFPNKILKDSEILFKRK